MSAPVGNKNSAGASYGKGGKPLNDRKLAADVRTLALSEIYKILKEGQTDGNKDLYRAVLIRLAGNVLPRLNEHSGPDGEPLIPFADIDALRQNNSAIQNSQAGQENTSDTGRDVSLKDSINFDVSDNPGADGQGKNTDLGNI